MKKQTAKGSNLFLLELIIAILFFSLSSALCIQLFTKSHLKATAATNLNMALLEAQSAAEGIRATDGAMNQLLLLFPESIIDTNTLTTYYDASWNACGESSASYKRTIELAPTPSNITGRITLTSAKSSQELYRLVIEKHIANRRSSDEP